MPKLTWAMSEPVLETIVELRWLQLSVGSEAVTEISVSWVSSL